MVLGLGDPEFFLDRGTQQREVAVAQQPSEPRLDVEERGREPSVLLGRGLPVVHPTTALLGLGVDGLDHVGGFQRPAHQREHPQSVEGEGLLEALIETGRRRLVDLVQLPTEALQGLAGLLVRGPLVGALQTPLGCPRFQYQGL